MRKVVLCGWQSIEIEGIDGLAGWKMKAIRLEIKTDQGKVSEEGIWGAEQEAAKEEIRIEQRLEAGEKIGLGEMEAVAGVSVRDCRGAGWWLVR